MPSTTFEDSRKRDEEVKKRIRSGSATDFRNKEDISKKSSEISPVPIKAVIPPPDSDYEDYKSGLICRRRLFLKKARMVTGERRAKRRALLKALERPGISQLLCRRSQTLLMSRDKRQHPLQSSLITPFIFLTPLCNRSARCRFVVFVLFFIPFPSWEFC